ncbi:GNAT family N-acetyltransferase [Stappia sp. F7233]|uniref:GNAT family N-acetyltransferase n=1 Tax=Stappia albiluteola TaxID=2758565 RepID=A0A839AFW7_9HYPH|nr:GNAT family N-acetyltransferase [Stappia albiluteola]MBA5777772.1 GNAT family N-acetyltransferase [Stappia albiluteola]
MQEGFTGEWKAFDELTVRELYDACVLRVAVFIVEQACAYAEIDGRDPDALHFLLRDEAGRLAAYQRLFAPQGDGPARLGRIVVSPDFRGKRLGDFLIREGIAKAAALSPDAPLCLSAQAHLERFYSAHGFTPVSDIYDEDGIPHVDMRRQPHSEPGAAA